MSQESLSTKHSLLEESSLEASSLHDLPLDQLLNIMQKLREHCPWDRAQTPVSLTRYAIEEAYEVEQAVRSGELTEIREELGDLLLQVVFQSEMYREQGTFDFYDVIETLKQKLIRRHPHVFQAESFQALNEEEVAVLWQQIKRQERQGQVKKRLDEIKAGPAVLQAQAIQKNAAAVGFDFANVKDAYAKLEEELQEFKEACMQQDSDEMLAEFGDCLFSFINVGRKLNLCAETALLSTIHKFKSRFAYIEDQALQQNKNIESMSLTEMDQLWEQAKRFLEPSKTQ